MVFSISLKIRGIGYSYIFVGASATKKRLNSATIGTFKNQHYSYGQFLKVPMYMCPIFKHRHFKHQP